MRSAVDALDHLVLATPDLSATTAWFAEATGVEPTVGGRHVGRGTHNVLCSLGPTSYLEIVGPDPDQAEPSGGRPFGIDRLTSPTIVGWAIAVADMDAAIAGARQGGVDPGVATAMERERPDGVTLRWRLTVAPSTTVPFLIDWLGSPHPAPQSARGLELISMCARHPRPDQLSDTLAALGVTLDVDTGPEALLVELRGLAGNLTFV